MRGSAGLTRSAPWAVAAGACALAALGLAVQHPVAPGAVSLGVVLALLVTLARPHAWLFVLPAALPLMSLAHLTGWWLVDESDLLVLACLAGGFARWAWDHGKREGPPPERGWWFAGLWAALMLTLLLGVWLGVSDAGVAALSRDPWPGALYAGYDSAWNTVRVAKSLFWALLLALLLRSPGVWACRAPARLVARGMLTGLGLVCGLVLWERLAYAGVLDFSQPYRTSAGFWEMHVGGGAIDAYLAMAVPFAFWAVWRASTVARWVGANALMVASVYAVLTTYSRGLYLAVLIALVFMAMAGWRWNIRPAAGVLWSRRSLAAMFMVLGLESALVLGGGSFMAERLSRSDLDMVGRVAHWRAGIGLLKSPTDWIFGLGVGRLPAHYSREVPGGGYPGQALWRRDAAGQAHVQLLGPLDDARRTGLFALTQRVDLGEGGMHRVRLSARGSAATDVVVSLCERHLLHDYRCQWRRVSVEPQAGAEPQPLEVALDAGPFVERGWPHPLRERVLAVTPAQAGPGVQLDRVEMTDAHGRQILRNPAFENGLSHWFPIAQGHFLPWHIDNLYLDVLIERGVLGLLVLAALVLWAGFALGGRLRRSDDLAWVMAASLLGVMSLGAVISVTEVPRVSLILLILLWSNGTIRGQMEDVS